MIAEPFRQEQARRENVKGYEESRVGHATDAQREAAQAARDQLTIEFIDKSINELNALSAQYAAVIARMTAVVNDLSRGSPLTEGLQTLQTIVDRSSELLKK